MRLTGSFVLAPEVQILPATRFSEALRRRMGAEDGDFVLTQVNSRAHSKIVDAGAAALIQRFNEPRTIAQAIARYIRAQPPEREHLAGDKVLEDALPMLRSLIEEGLLVEASSARPAPAAESLLGGDQVESWTVVRCIQSLEDTELYLVSNSAAAWGALKIARSGDPGAARMLAREERFLRDYGELRLPRLLASGSWRERPYLVTGWIRGVDAESAAIELRTLPGAPLPLHELCAKILEAYAELHDHGLLHGDIHPRNLLVNGAGDITILDFGVAVAAAAEFSAHRGGIGFYYEPEFARAALDAAQPPAASFAGEQYSIAALLYLLITGAHTQDFNFQRTAMLTQIANGDMVPFAQRGIAAWPEAEQVLGKALSRDPLDRYPSTGDFADAWQTAQPSTSARRHTVGPSRNSPSALREVRREVLRKSAIGGEWMCHGFKAAPNLSVNSGMAGLACALLQIAIATDDGELLATADAWSTRAMAALESPRGFDTARTKPDLPKIGLASLHHQRTGVILTHALIAAARGDHAAQYRAALDYLEWGRRSILEPQPPLDLTLGFSGMLLGTAMLLDALPPGDMPLRVDLAGFGRNLYAELWARLDAGSPLAAPSGARVPDTRVKTGAAHGWAGILYASLSWCGAAGEAPPPTLLLRLNQLAARAEPIARGYHWPWGKGNAFPSWCNGSAGHIFLWTEAHKATADPRYLTLAEGAAWNTWESPSRASSLCCGMAGQAYALLNYYRATGEDVWLGRARELANWAAEAATYAGAQTADAPPETRPGSLYNALAGLAVLDADLERPLEARIPLLERE